jgi:hypothetical protein
MIPVAARAGAWRPELAGSLGGTFMVLGLPNEGGSSASLAVLWPVAPHFSFGVAMHGDDAGSVVDSLRDGNGHGLAYGKVEQLHRTAWGASWRMDAVASPWHGLLPFASGTWGYYRIADDLRGDARGHLGTTGFSLAAGVRQGVGRHLAVGASIRYHRLFNDVEGRFVSAGLDGTWR